MKIEVNIPDGKSGEWEIKTRIVEEPDPLTKARAALREYGRIVPAGTYKILYRKNIRYRLKLEFLYSKVMILIGSLLMAILHNYHSSLN